MAVDRSHPFNMWLICSPRWYVVRSLPRLELPLWRFIPAFT